MIKKFALSVALSLALVGGGIAASTGAPVTAPAAAAASQAAPAVQLLASIPAPAAVQVAPLSSTEMTAVQGDGLWKKFKKWVKKVIKKVVGVIIKEIIEAITDWLEEIFSNVTGGENLDSSDVRTREYASQYDYDIDNAYSDNTQYNDFQQTNVWYGDGGGCSGGDTRDNTMMYEREVTAC